MGVRINGKWHEELADPGTGGTDTGNGRNYNSASDYTAAVGGTTTSPAANTSVSGGGDSNRVSAAAKSADDQLTKLIAALSATNEQDFQQKVSEFNQTHSLALQNFGLAQQKQQFDQAVAAAGLTGTYNGQQTQQAQQQQFSQALQTAAQSGVMANGQPTESAREFNTNVGVDLTKLGASLSGPADYFKFNNAMNNGQSILGSLTGDKTRPAFSAPPAGSIQPLTLGGIMDRLGITSGTASPASPAGQPQGTPTGSPLAGGTSGGNNQQAIPGGAGGGSAMGLTLPNGMGSIPLPHQINPSVWDSWGTTGQAFIKSAAAAAGYDPNEYEKQVNATRPGTMTAVPQGASAFAGAGGGGQSVY